MHDCSLSDREQTRNLLIYAANWCLIYFASPVVYVGIVQATLLKRLGFNDLLSNLPAAVYLFTTPLPVVIVWLFPQTRMLKPLMVTCCLTNAAMCLVVVAALLFGDANTILLALISEVGVLGCTAGVQVTCLWEAIGKGVSEARRGQVLGLAFGVGPFFAVLASLATNVLLSGRLPGLDVELIAVDFPWNFAILFLAGVPAMALAALLSSRFVVPPESDERPRHNTGLSFIDYFGSRLIVLAALAYILVYSGFQVLQNVSLYTQVAIGESPDRYAGLQLALRFGFKIAAGFLLGWLLLRSNPKTLLIVTAAIVLAGVAWAAGLPGHWYLLSFGILGAGELFGVYYPNYILGCSPRERMRQYMALTSLITMPVGFAPLLYGRISDSLGTVDKSFGFQMSFLASGVILTITILLVSLGLPARPRVKPLTEAQFQAQPGSEA